MKNTVEPLHNGHLGHKQEWPLKRRGRYAFAGIQHCVKKRSACFDIKIHDIFLKHMKNKDAKQKRRPTTRGKDQVYALLQ